MHYIDGQIGTLKYIADSPPEERGGFGPLTVEAAKWAIKEIERLQAENNKFKGAILRHKEFVDAVNPHPCKGDTDLHSVLYVVENKNRGGPPAATQ